LEIKILKVPFQSKANTRLIEYIQSAVIRIDLELIFFYKTLPTLGESKWLSAIEERWFVI